MKLASLFTALLCAPLAVTFSSASPDPTTLPLHLVGTAAHGAVLYTAGSAAMRGFEVVVPVDGASSENTYAEQVTAWLLTNAPTISSKVSLTKIDLIGY